jgi:hypothetical protein
MEPDKYQPIKEPQKAPQQSEIPIPEAERFSQVTSQPVAHPAQVTPNTSQEKYQRPVSAWQPKVEAESKQSVNPEIRNNEAALVGTEVLEAASEPTLHLSSAEPDLLNTTSMVNRDGTDSIVGPTDQLEAAVLDGSNPMSDNQAEELFKEEPRTKKHFKNLRFKKGLKVGIAVLIMTLITAVGYLFIAGNHAASSYKKSSSLVAYRNSFTGITESLSKATVDPSEVEAQYNTLKVLEGNSNRLSSVFGGSLNPKYKSAQQLQALEQSYILKASTYQGKFSDYSIFISTLSGSYSLLTNLNNFNRADYKVETAESLRSDLQKTYKSCVKQIANIQKVSKPSNLSSASQQLSNSLKTACTDGNSSLRNGPLVTLSEEKTGILTPETQQLLTNQFQNTSELVNEILNGSGSESFELNTLSAYQREALSEATSLKDAANALLAT